MKRLFLFLSFFLTLSSHAAATSLRVDLPVQATTSEPFTFTVTARNGDASTDTGYTGTVHFTSSDTGVPLPADYTFTLADAGVHTFTATFTTGPKQGQSDLRTITATDTANSGINGTDTIRVYWAADVPRLIRFGYPANPMRVVDRGTPVPIEVQVLNAYYAVITWTGTIKFRATEGVVVPPDYTFTAADAGRHMFSWTFNLGGSSSIIAEDAGDDLEGWLDIIDVVCTDSDFIVLATNDGPACPYSDNSAVHATASIPGITFTWRRTGSLSWKADGADVERVPAGTYNVWASGPNRCTIKATTVVGTAESRDPQIVAPQSVCGNSVTVTVTDPDYFTSYDWHPSNGVITSGQGTPTVTLTAQPAAYNTAPDGGLWIYVNTTNGSGCNEGSNYRRIQFYEGVAEADISTPSAACPNATLNASVPDAGAGASYAWTITNGTITNGQGTSSITYTPSGTGNVTLGASVNRGECSDSDSAVVTVNGPTASVNGMFYACNGDVDVPVTLAGTAPFRIVWSDGVVQENITTTSVTRTFSASMQGGEFFITSVSDATCSGTTSGVAVILAPRAPEITDQPDSVTIKPAEQATLTVAASGDVREFRWYEGASGDRSKLVGIRSGPTFTTPKLTQTTRYWVEAVNACASDLSQTATVTVGAGRHRAARH